MNSDLIELTGLPRDTRDPFWRRKRPQSIRALRTAPGSSKLIAYRMTQPPVFYKLAPSGLECEHKMAFLEWNKSDVAPRTQHHVSRGTVTDFTAGELKERGEKSSDLLPPL
jgi:hypothetical protein